MASSFAAHLSARLLIRRWASPGVRFAVGALLATSALPAELLAGARGSFATTSEASPTDRLRLDPHLIPWSRLEFEANKLFLTALCSLEIHTLQQDESRSRLVDMVSGEPLLPTGDVVEVRSHTSFLGRFRETSLLVEPSSAAAYQRRLVETGGRTRFKLYRFGQQSVFTARAEPANRAERGQTPDKWTRRENSVGADTVAERSTDAMAILYALVARASGASRKPIHLRLFSDPRVLDVEIVLAGSEMVPVKYRVDGFSPRQETVRALRFEVRLAPEDRAEGADIFGLEGDLSILIDEDRRLPLEIRGKVFPVGQVRVRLVAVASRAKRAAHQPLVEERDERERNQHFAR